MQIVGYETAPEGDVETVALHVAVHATDALRQPGDADVRRSQSGSREADNQIDQIDRTDRSDQTDRFEQIDRIELAPGAELAYSLGDRHCAGTVQKGRHLPCSKETAPYCDLHADRWPCARCTGECTRPVKACREEHAIYLAAFAPDTFKVGVTRSWRLQTRLREQGADRAAHIRTVDDGRIARQIEAEIAATISDRVGTPKKVEGMHRRVDERQWNELHQEFDPIETFDFDYGFTLTERPMVETIVSGTIIGTKGRILVLETAGSTYAVDMRDLVGYELTAGGLDRSLQSSFGAFQ